MIYKQVKTYFKNLKLKNRLKKNQVVFNLDDYNFKAKNVLIIDDIIPEYNKDSGSRRLTEIIKLLIKNNIGVFLLADLKQYKYKSSYISYFKNLGVNVYEPSIENNTLITKELFISRILNKIDIAWLHRPTIFSKFNEFIKNENPNTKLIFDMVDFHYIRFLREYEVSKDPAFKREADKFLKIELENCKKADTIIAISNTDELLLDKHFKQKEKVVVLSNIHNYKQSNKGFKPFNERDRLLFVGGFKHKPNIDAVKHLKETIMPLIWQTHPEIEIDIIGSSVTEEILDLNSVKFNIIGFVEDIDAVLNSAKLFVAPLRFGAGIKGKIGQSLEFSLPLVTTSIGEEGFDFGLLKDTMIAKTDEEFADLVINLYNDSVQWESAGNYCETILKPFSLPETEKALLSILHD